MSEQAVPTRAVVIDTYGSPEVLHLEAVSVDGPAPDEVLVRNHAASVNFGDLMVRKLDTITRADFYMPTLFLWLAKLMFGRRKPRVRILGSEFAGVVEAVGEDVRAFKPGDRVYGYTGPLMGCYADHVKLKANRSLALMPENLAFTEAATLPYGAVVAASLLRKISIAPGSRVLVIGASGGIGSAALRLLKHHYAAEVTGVCSTRHLDAVKALGADRVIDYTHTDFSDEPVKYDLIFDVLGKSSFADCRKVLTERGTCFLASFRARRLLEVLWSKLRGGPRLRCAIGSESAADLDAYRTLAEAGKITTMVDRVFPAEQAAAAHAYAESRQARGNVVLSFAADPDGPA